MPAHDVQEGSLSGTLMEVGLGSAKLEEEEDCTHDPSLRLRTITSVISAIQKHLHVGFSVSQREADMASGLISARYQEPLRALTAFATLLVRDTEVTAVAIAKPIPLALVACASEQGTRLDLFTHGRDFLATRNPRTLGDQANDGVVTADPEEFNPADPLEYLHKHWWVPPLLLDDSL
jgi:hypothetical protein